MVERPERRVVSIVCLALLGSCAGAAIAGAFCEALGLARFVPVAVGTLAGIAIAVAFAGRLAVRLPAELDGWFTRRRIVRWIWIAGAVLAVANTARISVFAMDPSQAWASAFPPIPESAQHACLAAYVRAGELAALGHDDLWDPEPYASGHASQVAGLGPYLGDPYEYPPPFALLPRAAVAATDSYQLIRDVWFGLSAVGFLAAFVVLAVWTGGRGGATALLLVPAVALSTPFVFTLQWGQAHALVIACAMLAMLQFARDRMASGAMLLAFATATKLFPGLLLVYLAVQRRWRAIGATLVALAAFTALAAIVLGPGTLAAFVTEQLPRMASGKAFAFTETNPDNNSIYSLAFKLGALGVPGLGRAAASLFAWIWTLVAVGLAWRGSRALAAPQTSTEPQAAADPRAHAAILWLGILCLGTLRSPYAPLYTAIATLWLFSLATSVRAWPKWLVAIAWILLMGFPPLGSAALNAGLSLPSQLISIVVPVIAVWPRART